MQQKNPPHRLIAIYLAVVILLGAGLALKTASARPQSMAQSAHSAVNQLTNQPIAQSDAPPVLTGSTPPTGSAWSGGPVTFTFDQPMADDSAQYLQVQPPLEGTATVDGATLVFTPAEDPAPGQRYVFTIDTRAGSAAGVPLNAPVDVPLTGAVPLQVSSTQPGDDAEEIDTTSDIVVVFNHPVVPLSGVEQPADGPQPLTIEPALAGEGRWLNTSIYTFQPETYLAGATEYQVTVDNVTGLGGETLDEPFVFTFTTTSPIVTDAQPEGPGAAPDSDVRVTFSQPMDQESVAQAFTLTEAAAEQAASVDGTPTWDAAGTTLIFTPTQALEFGATYAIQVDESAQSAAGAASLRIPFRREFTVAPLPAVESIAPEAGATGIDPDQSVVLKFNTPVSRTTVVDSVNVTPLLTTTQVYSYYAEYSNELTLSWFKEANTTYTVTVGEGVVDRYGNVIDEPFVSTFTTGDYAPFVRTNLERFTHYSAYTQTQVSVLYRNIDQLEAELFRLPQREFFKLTGENKYQFWENYAIPDRDANRIWARSYALRAGENVTAQEIISLTTPAGDPLPPGMYLLELPRPQRPAPDPNAPPAPTGPAQHVIVLSNDNLVFKKSARGESIAWITVLLTGEPVAEREVRFYRNGEQLADSVTDENGIATARLALSPEQAWTPMIAVTGEPGAEDFAIVSSQWYDGIGPWEFNINSGFGAEQYRAHFYTDRPIYRPGQTIYWKGIIREIVDDGYHLPPLDLPIQITVRDDRGNIIVQEQVTPSEFGTVHGQVDLLPEATTGFYSVEASTPGEPGQPSYTYYGSVGVQVASYRVPEFAISVSTDQEEYVQDDTITVDVQADYFSGGTLAAAPVTWRLLSEPYFFNWEDAPPGRHYSFTPYDPENEDYDPYRGFYGGLLQEGTGVTDAQGHFTIELPADLSDAPQSQRWVFDVTVQSSTNQFVSGRAAAPVHKSDYYVGISPQSYVVEVGDENTVDFVTLTPQREPYPNAELTVIVQEFRWNSVYEQAADGAYRWMSSVERRPVLTETVSTDAAGTAQLTWTPDAGGQYQIVALGRDETGTAVLPLDEASYPISSAAFVYASTPDDSFVAWRRDNNDRMELVADQDEYEPGETAQVLVPSPFTGPVNALVTIERGGVLEARVITLEGNSQTLEVPIRSEYIPNVFVSVMLVKGVDETNPYPAMRIGYAQLNVDVEQRALDIAIEPSAETVQPSDTVSYTLTVADHGGAVQPDVEVSVALVDKAVLSLSEFGAQSLLDAFYNEQPLGVTTGALLVINRDRLSQQLSEGAKGGGGGGGPGLVEVREDFPDIAHWRADLVTDENGQIQFDVELPDNLTTWQLVARGVSTETLVGEATHDVIATKPLQIRPLLPRFFTAGDRAQIGAVVVNAAEGTLDAGQLMMSVDGATLESGMRDAEFALASGEQTRFNWPIAVEPTSDVVTFTFTANAERSTANAELFADAVRIAVPVNRYETPEVVATAGAVPPEGVTEAIRLPQDATENGELLVTLEPSLAAGMIDGLEYLQHFPYECNEQTVSRFLPNLFTIMALRQLDIENDELAEQLAFQLGVGVQRLVSRQNPDGGWGYWPGAESEPFITTYVLWGLWNARLWAAAQSHSIDYVVPQNRIDLAVNYLDSAFVAPDDVDGDWRLNEMAFMHYVLAEVGEGDPGRASTLFEQRERLAIYGQAFLALALDAMQEEANRPDERVETLLDNIYAAADLTATGAYWSERTIDYRTLNTDTRTTAIALAAFVRLDPDEPLLPRVVRWLMDAREAGHWSNTQENAWAIIALTEWLDASGELEANYDWTVALNGDELGSGSFGPADLDRQVQLRAAVADLLREEANLLRFERSNESGQLYYTTHLRYYLDALAVDARDRGIVVDRRFETERGPVEAVNVGDVISVTTTIVAPADLYHVLVEAPIPAGMEPIDPSLATESDQFAGPGGGAVDALPTEVGRVWRNWSPTHTDIRDDKVAFFATFLPAGTYEYTFQARATVPGEFRVLPVYAEQMYFNEVWGRRAGGLFTVRE